MKRYDLIRPTRCMIEENQRYIKIEREDQTTFVAYFTINNIVGELDFPSSEIFYYQQQQFTFPVCLMAGADCQCQLWVYKNFTAIDMHTVHEKEVIEQRIVDTNKIENFVKAFAKSYYSWSNTQESIEKRTAAINQYLTKSLQDLNVDTVRMDIPTSSTVTDVKIWEVEAAGMNDFTVVYSVDQTVTEGETTIGYTSAYMVVVHVDGDGNLVITQNPTISSIPTKSGYEPKTKESDGTVDAATTEEVTEFLETFFKLYPTATEKELAYYVSGNVLEPVNCEYVFSELVNPIFTQDGEQVKVSVSVKYLDQRTKATQISQFDLTLEKDSNWKIVK